MKPECKEWADRVYAATGRFHVDAYATDADIELWIDAAMADERSRQPIRDLRAEWIASVCAGDLPINGAPVRQPSAPGRDDRAGSHRFPLAVGTVGVCSGARDMIFRRLSSA